MTTIIFVIAIFFSIWWSSINFVKFIRGESIPWLNFVIMTAAFTAVITHVIGIW